MRSGGTQLQGQPMTHLRIEADGKQIFDCDVRDWTPPPEIPTNPVAANYSALPKPIREALAMAAAQAFETATGFKVKIEV